MTRPKKQFNFVDLKNLFCNFITSQYSCYNKIFTDGSKDKEGSGASFYDYAQKIAVKFQIDSNVCIMDAELIAIAEALSYIESTDHINTVILTDSKSSLQHLARCTSTFRGTPIAYTILDNILRLQSLGKNVVLQWIPSHIGLEGNDFADLLAKQAISDQSSFLHKFYTKNETNLLYVLG